MLLANVISDVFETATKIKTPLVLSGFTIATLLFVILKSIDASSKTDRNNFLKFVVILVFVLALVGMFLGVAAYVFPKLGNHVPGTARKTVYGRIVDANRNGLSGVTVYLLNKEDTIYADPRSTGSEGRFSITIDTSSDFQTTIYFTKNGQMDNDRFNTLQSADYTFKYKDKPGTDQTPANIIIQGALHSNTITKLKARLLKEFPNKEYLSIRFNYDPSRMDRMGINSFRYNENGHLLIYVNDNCHSKLEGLVFKQTNGMGAPKQEVINKLNEQLNTLVSSNIPEIIKEIKRCAN